MLGPISGSDPKIDSAVEKYIYTNFAYGSGMGATQAAQHIKTHLDLSSQILSWINQRHTLPFFQLSFLVGFGWLSQS
jgi:hypothetical protein